MRKIFILIAFTTIYSFCAFAKDYSILSFGAVPDGFTNNTTTIQKAIDYINSNGGGQLLFERGNYVTGTIYLKSGVTLHLKEGAVLLGSVNPLDYDKHKTVGWTAMIFAIKQQDIGIVGKGTIDGRGFTVADNVVELIHKGLVNDPLKLDRPNETNRPENIYFRECTNVTIKGITLKDPASWNQTYDQCVNLYVDSITVDSKSYWNNDGIDVVDCKDVVIKNSHFDAADDGICFKSHDVTKMCENVTVDNCTIRSSANGLKFGTVSRGGFKNFKITHLKVYDTYRSAITFAAVDGALVENIYVNNVTSLNTGNVIYLRIGDRWSNGKKPVMKDIVISDVYAEVPLTKPDAGYNYEGPVEDLPRNISPASIVGLTDHPVQNITLRNIKIVYPGAGNPHYAYRGLAAKELDSIPEMRKSYPEFSQFKELPAWGFYIRNANDIIFDNVVLIAKQKDYRPAIVLQNVNGFTIKGGEIKEPGGKKKKQIHSYKSQMVVK